MPSVALETLESRTLFSQIPLFKVTSLVSDSAAVPALHHDKNLVDGWGLAVGPDTALWVANNGTGTSTLYDGNGSKVALNVSIPEPDGSFDANSTPSGEVFNGTSGFAVQPGKPAEFIYATETGTISAWAPNANPTKAIIRVNNSTRGGDYTGLAMGTFNSKTFLYVANFGSRHIEAYDSNFHGTHLPGTFRDPSIPSGYSPFGIQNVNGLIYVSYARQDLYEGQVAGKGNGYISVFNPDGTFVKRLASRGSLNAPWGMTRISTGFGDFNKMLAVGNFGDGMIQVFNPGTGKFLGYLINGKHNKPVKIDGLWGITFGSGGSLGGGTKELFFVAGPNGESNGLFGKLTLSGFSTGATPTQQTPPPSQPPGYIVPMSAKHDLLVDDVLDAKST